MCIILFSYFVFFLNEKLIFKSKNGNMVQNSPSELLTYRYIPLITTYYLSVFITFYVYT